jgi:1-acyl-sn-glycerol-3-phosphate acyltransferase
MARGYLTLAVLGAFLLAGELASRTVLGPAVFLLGRFRTPLLTVWMRGAAGVILAILRRVGDARVEIRDRIPGREGVLVIGNHQSLLDIPVVVWALEASHPRIVTRRRYARGVPMVSHVLRLTDAPLVDPDRAARPQVEALGTIAAACRHPLVVFPEGHRSRDGALRPFRRGGLGAILAARPWKVYLLVVDGLWSAGRFRDLVRALRGLRGVAASVGPIDWPGPGADPDAFIDDLERRMAAELKRLRGQE